MSTITLQEPPDQVRVQGPPRRTLQDPKGRLRNEQGGTFRLLCGVHLDFGPENCDCDACHFWEQNRQYTISQKKPDPGPCPNHRYEAYDDYTVPNGSRFGGYIARCHQERVAPTPREQYTNDIIKSKRDLDRLYNGARPDMKKFERLDGATAAQPGFSPPPEPFPLDQMTIPQLLAVAQEEEIDLTTVKKDKQGALDKADLLRVVRASYGK